VSVWWVTAIGRAGTTLLIVSASRGRDGVRLSLWDGGRRGGDEVELPQSIGLDQNSTGDVWATGYRGDSVQEGARVGVDRTDRVLENGYVQCRSTPPAAATLCSG
jgi:hypothetical protein